MQNKNDYGFYSGGYIFDRLDRAALKVARREALLKDKQLYTQSADIQYKKQLCNLNGVHTRLLGVEWVGNDEYEVQIALWQGTTEIAVAYFNFKVATHNYCETKGEKL